jgi:tetratricopeptide (TPR) repeat protein
LRPEINRHVEEWSLDILKIGDKKFQEGQLSEAIKIARRIPENVSAYKLVENRIDRWQTIWSKAEAIYEQAENQLRESNWLQAFREAVKLTSINNKYWATAKYDQLTNQIQIARKASEQLDKAYQLSKSGRIADILAAIKQAEEIPSNSYAYKEAQELIADCGNKLLKLAMNRLEQRNWKGVLEIANKIPASVKLGEVKTDLIDLANALSRGESGTVSELETAIATAVNPTPVKNITTKTAQNRQLRVKFRLRSQNRFEAGGAGTPGVSTCSGARCSEGIGGGGRRDGAPEAGGGKGRLASEALLLRCPPLR